MISNVDEKMKTKLLVIGVGIIVLILIIILISKIISSKKTEVIDVPADPNECVLKDELKTESNKTLSYLDFFKDSKCLSKTVTVKYERIDGKERDLVFVQNEQGEDVIYSIGEFNASIYDEENQKSYVTKLIIEDKTPPELTITNVVIKQYEEMNLEDFIYDCKDNSGDTCTYSFYNIEKVPITAVSQYTGTSMYFVEAKDSKGNMTTKEVTLTVKE